MFCQFALCPKLVVPCAWYKTPGTPVQLRTTLSPLRLTFRFDATLTAGAEIAARPHSDARTNAPNAEPRHALWDIGTAAAAKSLKFCTGEKSKPSRQFSYIIRQMVFMFGAVLGSPARLSLRRWYATLIFNDLRLQSRCTVKNGGKRSSSKMQISFSKVLDSRPGQLSSLVGRFLWASFSPLR